jgi:hypothetical protein
MGRRAKAVASIQGSAEPSPFSSSLTIRRPGSSTTACPRRPSSATSVDLPPPEHPEITTNGSKSNVPLHNWRALCSIDGCLSLPNMNSATIQGFRELLSQPHQWVRFPQDMAKGEPQNHCSGYMGRRSTHSLSSYAARVAPRLPAATRQYVEAHGLTTAAIKKTFQESGNGERARRLPFQIRSSPYTGSKTSPLCVRYLCSYIEENSLFEQG